MIKKVYKKMFKTKNIPKRKLTDDTMILKNKSIGSDLEKTVSDFKRIYSYPANSDVVFRDIQFGGMGKKATLLFIKTITDIKNIEDYVITPLLNNSESHKNIEDTIYSQSITTAKIMKDIAVDVNKGNVALFIDGEAQAYIISASKYEGRSVEKPDTEIVVKGPKEAFNENISTNISLVRKKIKNESLVVESTTISKRSNNEVYIVYIKDLVNDQLLHNIKNRVAALDVDAIQNLALLEQYIEERQLSIFPTILYTERPDRAAAFLEDGHIILLMDNSPDSLVLPATFWSFYHISEDHYLRFPYGNVTRLLRAVALFITLFTSSIYIAVTSFHTEMIPPDLLLAIASTREKVPFPVFLEVLLMELAFELIREGGLRVPTPIGPTISIVGALILGQAAVQANVVSPIVVIVVALSGLCSYVISDISMNFAIRITRFMFIFSAALFGLYGVAAFLVAGLAYLVSIKSFGVPYFSPFTPTYKSSGDTLFRKLLKNEIFRPGYLKTKDITKKSGDSS